MSWLTDFADRRPVLAKVAVTPFAGLYALGAGLNRLTGGDTDTLNVYRAIHGTSDQSYSTFTQAASGYTGDDPGVNVKPNQGRQGLPIVNPSTPYLVQDVADAALDPLGLDLKKLLFLAGGAFIALEALK